MPKIHLLIVDPQNDFCHPDGALYVPGAEHDAERLKAMILRIKDRIDAVHVTLDTHQYLDIAHPVFWIDDQGRNPEPFTIILEEEVQSGLWKPADEGLLEYARHYVRQLKIHDRYDLCIWPPHTLIGSWGHNVASPVYEALIEWQKRLIPVDFVLKGFNFLTEHYSAIQADVPDEKDPSTLVNTRLIEKLRQSDMVAISGQALSHCVANTVRDLARECGEDLVKKLVLVEDTSSPVSGFEDVAENFVKEMKMKGMQTARSDELLV